MCSFLSQNWLSLGLKRAHEQQSSLKSDQLHISAVNLQRKRDNSEVRAAKIVKNSQQERELDWYSTQHMHVEEDTALAQMSSNALAFQEKGPNAERCAEIFHGI